jgi:hypothetical protein
MMRDFLFLVVEEVTSYRTGPSADESQVRLCPIVNPFYWFESEKGEEKTCGYFIAFFIFHRGDPLTGYRFNLFFLKA